MKDYSEFGIDLLNGVGVITQDKKSIKEYHNASMCGPAIHSHTIAANTAYFICARVIMLPTK